MDVIRERPRSSWSGKKKRWIIGGSAAVLVAACGLWGISPAIPSVPADSLQIDTVKRGDMVRRVSGPGMLVAVETRLIPSILPKAQVQEVVVQPGAEVHPDTVILRLSNPMVEQQFDEVKLRLDVATAEFEALRKQLADKELDQQSRVAEVRSDYEAARLQAESESKLTADKIISEIQYRKSRLSEQLLKTQLGLELSRARGLPQANVAELRAKQAQLALLRRQLDLQKNLLDSLQVTAGIDGILQEVRVKEGQGVDQGEMLAVVARQDRLKAEIRIPESQAQDIVIGQPAEITIGGQSVAGQVARIDPSVIDGTVRVDVAFPGEPPKQARTNLRVTGTIEIEQLKNILYVSKPAQAHENGETELFVLDPSGVATLTRVRLGRASTSTIEVVQGLSEGNQVVLSDTSKFSETQQFQLD